MVDLSFVATPAKVFTAVRYRMHGDLIDLDKEFRVHPAVATSDYVPFLGEELLYEDSLTTDPACVARAIRDDSQESLSIDRTGAIQFALENLPNNACSFALYEVISVGLTEPTVPTVALASTARNLVYYVANPFIRFSDELLGRDWDEPELRKLRETVEPLRGDVLHRWMIENRQHVTCPLQRRTCFDNNAQFAWFA